MTGRLSQRSLVLLVICVVQSMVILDGSVVNVALPSIQDDLGFSRESLQWVINAYVLTYGGCMLLGGRAADLLGRRRVLIGGLVLFTAASLACALAPSAGVLIAARAAQGLGAAIISPAALSIVTSTFAEGPERNRALSFWAAVSSASSAFGVLLGGLLTASLSWEWVFYVNLPIGIAMVVAGLRVLPETREDTAQGYDIAGAATVTIGLALLVYVIVKAESFGWTSAGTIALFLLAVGLLALFTQIERRTRWPLMPLGVFRLRGLSAANGVQVLIGAAFAPSFYFLALYFQQVLGYSALEAGLAYLPLTCGMMVSAGLASKVAMRFGVRPALVAGLLCVVAAMLMLAQVSPTGSFVVDVLPATLVFAAGLGLTWIPTTIAAMQGVPKRYAGLASGLFNTSFQIGGALGLAVLSALAAWRTSALLGDGARTAQAAVDGYRLGFYVAAGIVLAIVLLVVPLFPAPGARAEAEPEPEPGPAAP